MLVNTCHALRSCLPGFLCGPLSAAVCTRLVITSASCSLAINLAPEAAEALVLEVKVLNLANYEIWSYTPGPH